MFDTNAQKYEFFGIQTAGRPGCSNKRPNFAIICRQKQLPMNRLLKRIFLALIVLPHFLSAQTNPARLELGGNVGLQFGTVTAIDLSPTVGYWITDYLISGLGLTYLYTTDSRSHYSSDVYGGRLFTSLCPLPEGFLQAEYQIMNVGYRFPGETQRDWYHGLLAGGGYLQGLGGNSYLSLTVLWDLLQQPGFPYDNPIIRAGFVTRL